MQTEVRENLELPIYYHSNQKKIFFDSKVKKKVIAKGRRFGLTHGYANRAIEYLLDGISPGLWVDTVNGNIDKYVERYFYPILRQLPQKYWKWRQQKKELEICGHKLDMRSADRPELIEGFAYKFIMLNEAGIILRKEYLYYNSILPMTLDFNPDFYIGGTPKGKGLFHELAVRADDSEKKDQQFFQFSSYDNPYLDNNQRQRLIDEIPKSIQAQEIYGEFLEDSSTVFRNIDKCATAAFQEPITGERYILGVDLARLQDYTIINVMDNAGNQVYLDRFNEIDWKVQRERIKFIALKYNDAQIWLDATGVGDPICQDLVDMGLNVHPYKFTNESKKQLIQALMLSLEQEKIRILKKDLAPIQYNELVIFEYEMTSSGLIRYQAPEGYHDDCVIGLALANMGVQSQLNVGPGMVYHKGLEKKERAEVIMEDIELAEKTRQMIDKYGYAALGAFAHSMSMPGDVLRQRLVDLGFKEHKPNRFIYGDNFKMPEKPAEKPEIKRMQEEREGWVA